MATAPDLTAWPFAQAFVRLARGESASVLARARPEVVRLLEAGFPFALIEELAANWLVTPAAAEFAAVLLEGGLCTPAEAAHAILAG